MSEPKDCVILHVDMTVDASEIATWSGQRITQFFRGVAMAKAAKEGLLHLPSTNQQTTTSGATNE